MTTNKMAAVIVPADNGQDIVNKDRNIELIFNELGW